MKSPPQSLTPTNNFGLPSSTLQSNTTKQFNAAAAGGQNRGGANQRFNFNTNVHNPIQQFAAAAAVAANQKFNNPLSLQNTGNY